MSEQISWSSIFTIIGVVIGFTLSQLTDIWKNKRKKDMIKKALVNELRIVEGTLSGALEAEQRRVPVEKFPFITETYDSTKVELASFLKPDSLALIQRTYEQIKKLNEPKGPSPLGYMQFAGSTDYSYIQSEIEKVVPYVEKSIKALN